uniref:Uncharacterized protein n=1 Tax=Cucumis melo TaxID=3656 RepID=A0A9I9E8R6_CUCME
MGKKQNGCCFYDNNIYGGRAIPLLQLGDECELSMAVLGKRESYKDRPEGDSLNYNCLLEGLQCKEAYCPTRPINTNGLSIDRASDSTSYSFESELPESIWSFAAVCIDIQSLAVEAKLLQVNVAVMWKSLENHVCLTLELEAWGTLHVWPNQNQTSLVLRVKT